MPAEGLPSGLYDFTFEVFDASSSGNSYGGIISDNAVLVTNGVFTVVLDFGSGVFTGPSRWLQISVSSNKLNNFSILAPRQELNPTPYAQYATASGSVPNASITSAQLASGSVGNSQIQANAVNASQIAAGQVVKSINGLADNVTLTSGPNITLNTAGNSLQISAPNTGGWGLSGNSGTTAGADYIGTTDNQPLEFHIFGQRALRLEPTATIPNIIGGFIGNLADTGVQGGTIGGGGTSGYNNEVGSTLGTVAGGSGNIISTNANDATIAGGRQNGIQGGAWGAAPLAAAMETLLRPTPNTPSLRAAGLMPPAARLAIRL